MSSFSSNSARIQLDIKKVDETNCQVTYWEITGNGKLVYRDTQTTTYTAIDTDVTTKLAAIVPA